MLYRHAPQIYAPMLAAARDDVHLVELERTAFGCGHDDVGANLCEAWGLTPAAVASVRHHINIHTTMRLPRVSHRYICVLSALAHTIVNDPAQLDEVAMKLAPQAMLDQTSLLRGLHRVKDKIRRGAHERLRRRRIDDKGSRGCPFSLGVARPARCWRFRSFRSPQAPSAESGNALSHGRASRGWTPPLIA